MFVENCIWTWTQSQAKSSQWSKSINSYKLFIGLVLEGICCQLIDPVDCLFSVEPYGSAVSQNSKQFQIFRRWVECVHHNFNQLRTLSKWSGHLLLASWLFVCFPLMFLFRLMIYGDRNRTVEEELSGNSKFFGLPLRQTKFNSFIWKAFWIYGEWRGLRRNTYL